LRPTACTSSGEAGWDFNSLTTDMACAPVLGSAMATFADGEDAGSDLLDPAFNFDCAASSSSLVTVKLTEDLGADSSESTRVSR